MQTSTLTLFTPRSRVLKRNACIALMIYALIAPLIALHRLKKMMKIGSAVFELSGVENGNCAATR